MSDVKAQRQDEPETKQAMGMIHPNEFSGAGNVERLYELLGAAGMGAGWNKPEPSLWHEPNKNFVPAHWSYALARAALNSAGKLVSTELAERRNVRLFNSVPGNRFATLRTMVCAYHMAMPGESSGGHRHTPNALRLVIDAGPGSYTVVNGRKLPMLPGDVLLTPSWNWHGHRNEGADCGYWIDFLDTPLVQFLEPMFFEPLPGGAGMDAAVEADPGSPLRFPYADVCRRLDGLGPDDAGLCSVELGPPALDTISLQVWRLTTGQSVSRPRTTANSIFAVIEGEGTTVVAGSEFHWRRGDLVAVPAWCESRHEARSQTHLLRVSDEPLLQRLNWLRGEEPFFPRMVEGVD